MIKGWYYYHHALLPACAPHEQPDLAAISGNDVWHLGGLLLFIRWTTDFDCGHETGWWYVIKDTPFDISSLKAKRRYVINQGRQNFEVRSIQPEEYAEELLQIYAAAAATYSLPVAVPTDKDAFAASMKQWQVYGAFRRADGKLGGYIQFKEEGRQVVFSSMKAIPAMEKEQINAAMVNALVEHYNDRLGNDLYICDGARSVFHETAFQDYLEKYFGFRKAYCLLHIRYRPVVKQLVSFLYPFRKYIRGNGRLSRQLLAVLKMEEICRMQG